MSTPYTAQPETLRDVADSGNPPPQPTRAEGPVVERLCEYDESSQIGCRRTKTMFALEADFDTFVDGAMYWGNWDLFCQHEGHTYFHKDWIKENIKRDQDALAADSGNATLNAHVTTVLSHFGPSFHSGVTYETVAGMFKNNPAGFPTLTIETPNFFQCIDLGTDVITIDQLDRALLTKIKNTFVDDINPLLADLTNRLYLKDDKVYCADYLAFEQNASNKLGVLMIAKGSEKYTEGNAYFFPFNTLTAEQETAVRSLALLENDLKGEIVIVTL